MKTYEKPIAELVEFRPADDVMQQTLTLTPGDESVGDWDDVEDW